MTRVLAIVSLLALCAACGGRSTGVPSEEPSDGTTAPGDPVAVPRITLRSALPSCSKTATGALYYVVQDRLLVYCDGASYQDLALDYELEPNQMVTTGTAPSCAHGGTTVSVGLDSDDDGKLDQPERVGSVTACNAAPSPVPAACTAREEATPAGCVCAAGYVRVTPTAPCTELPAAPSKPTGEDAPCTTDTDCAGFEASFCDIFVTGTCLVRNCSVTPNSCFTGKECCELSAFGLPTLCIAAGACGN